MKSTEKSRLKGMYTVQVAMIVPIILVFLAICYDYMLYLNFKSGFTRTLHEYELNLNRYLNLSCTEFINGSSSWHELNPNVRNLKSLFDSWHRGIDNSHLEERWKQELSRILKFNLKDVESLEIEFKSGFFKNTVDIRYRIRANGLFVFSPKIERILGDFRVLEGEIHLYQENTYMDIIHIDLIADKLEKWNLFEKWIDDVNEGLDGLRKLF